MDIECAWDGATAGGSFSNVLDTILHPDWLCPREAQLLLARTRACAVGCCVREGSFRANGDLHQHSKCVETVIQRVNISGE